MALGTLGILGLATAAGGVAQASAAGKAADAQADAAADANAVQLQIHNDNTEINAPAIAARDNALSALLYESGLGPLPSNIGGGMQINEIAGTEATQGNPIYETERGAKWITGYEDGTAATAPQFLVGDQSFADRAGAQAYIDQNQGNAFGYQPISTPDPNLDLSTSAFEASPGYQFRLDEGNKALERMASARGMRFSGAAAKDAMRFGQGIGSEEYGNFVGRETDQFNRSYGVAQDEKNALRSIAGMGQNSASAQISSNNNYANAYGQNALTAGNAQAQGAIEVGNAFAGGVNSLGGLYGQGMSGYFGQNPGLGITPVFDPFAGAT